MSQEPLVVVPLPPEDPEVLRLLALYHELLAAHDARHSGNTGVPPGPEPRS